MLGKIESWGTKGYGFITGPKGEAVFCHITALEHYAGRDTEPPARGDEVMYEVERSPRSGRLQAKNVVLL